jgi:hypothetical protein
MISYCLATNKEPEILLPTLESISQLDSHEHEIVVCAPYPKPDWIKGSNITFVLDEINDGSTHAMNLSVKHSRGDWVVIGTDEHKINYNVNGFLKVIHSPEMERLEYQVVNMGSMWSDTINKQIVSFPPIDCRNIPTSIQNHSYPVVCLPSVSRKTIETKFDGLFFNPHLIHHFVDHWMGFYVSRKQPNYNFDLGRDLYIPPCQSAWMPFKSTWPSKKWDNHDANKFCNLAAIVIQNQKELSYTSDI